MLESPARQVKCHTLKKMPESTRRAGGQLELGCQPECLHSFGMLTTGFDWVHRDSESGPCHESDLSHWQQERLKLTHSSMGSSFWATDPMFYVLGPIGPVSQADDGYVASSTGYYSSDQSRRICGQKPRARNSLQQPQLESRCLALPAAK